MTKPAEYGRPDPSWFGAAGLVIPTEVVGPRGTLPIPLDASTGARAPAWIRLADALYQEELAHLEEDRGLVIPSSVLWGLEAGEQETLCLPPELPDPAVHVRSLGIPGKRSFRLALDITPAGSRDPLPAGAQRGPFVQKNGQLFRLPGRKLRRLAEVAGDEQGSTGLPQDLRRIAEVKTAAKQAGATVDSFLQREETLAPDGLTIEAEYLSPDEVHLKPVPVGADEFQEDLRQGPAKEVYSRIEGAKRRRRLVLNDQEVSALGELQGGKRLKGPDVARFQENPQAFVPESIDLSRFSPRVKGVVPRRYRSQPYLSVRPSANRDWFSVDLDARLFQDEDPIATGGEISEDFSGAAGGPGGAGSAGDLAGPGGADGAPGAGEAPAFGRDVFAGLCRRALETAEEYLLHEGDWIRIPLEEAQAFLAAHEQLGDEADGGDGLSRADLDLVLEVAPNLEVLEYSSEDGAGPAPRLGEVAVELPEYPVPSLLQAELRSYQLEGYRWLRYLHEKAMGGLLADDMGLGKTVQVISLLAHLKEEGALSPSIIIVPKSLIPNWVAEIRKFCPAIKRIYVHQGADRSRNEAFIAAHEVVITTYETFRNDQLLLARIDWCAAVCDEAQKVKNPSARVTAAVKALKARVRIAMTGTPVENGLSELWCIVDFIQAGPLGTERDFRERVERPITEGQEGSEATQEALEFLHSRLGPHYLRRTKRELASELPPRESRPYRVPLGERQGRVYDRVAAQVLEREVIPLAGLQYLIQACSHPELVEPVGQRSDLLVSECPKLDETMRILDGIRSAGEKVLLFTRYRRMQQILQEVLLDRYGVFASILNGEVAGGRRQSAVDEFQARSGFSAMILSPEAAGVGLNITAANHVVHYSRLWNPAKERQATDRVYRIGQTRPVMVHYPIVHGDGWKTVEEHLDDLLSDKMALAENVIVPSNQLDVTAEMQRRAFEAGHD